jgi:hypothetical protein
MAEALTGIEVSASLAGMIEAVVNKALADRFDGGSSRCNAERDRAIAEFAEVLDRDADV